MSEDRGRGPSAEALNKGDLWIALAFAFATLLATLVYTIKAKPAFPGDIERYIHIASSLLAKDISGAINYHYPPGYPAMIAVAGLAVNDFETAARAAGIVFVTLTVFPVYLLAFYLFGRRAAVFAVCLFSLRLFPELAQSRSEQVAIFFVSSAMLLGLVALDRRRSVWFLATGLVFGLGFLVKPEVWAYFLTYFSIVCLTAAVSIAGKTPGGSSGPAAESESDAGFGRPLFVRVRPFIFCIAVLVLGYFLAAGPYLLSYYRDTGEASLNPKAKTLFHIHNYLYKESRLHRIQKEDRGYFTQAQRIYMEGDRVPLPGSIPELLWKGRYGFLEVYPDRLIRSLRDNLAGRYFQKIAPWVWPVILLAGVWPRRDRKKAGLELYLHAFAIVHLIIVSFYSVKFTRFYFTMAPWMVIVLGRGVDRVIEAVAGRFGSRREVAARALSVFLVFCMAAAAVAGTVRAAPDSEFWADVEIRREVAEYLKAVLPEGCRFMSELERPSVWYLAGLPPQTQEITPAGDLEDVIIYAAVKEARYIVFHKSTFVGRYSNLLPLLEPGFTSPVLRLVYRRPGLGGDTYVIYEVLPVKCGRDVEVKE
jgi:4-amino-4-deoxy-L-arabinose transferase-like glycosyltransferase